MRTTGPATTASAILALTLAWLTGSPPASAQDFRPLGVEQAAKRLEATIAARPKATSPADAKKASAGKSAQDLRRDGEKLLASGENLVEAVNVLSEAAALNPADAETWLALARAHVATKTDDVPSSSRGDWNQRASGAAWLAHERAKSPQQKATALVVLHESFKRRELWRPAIDALKASLVLVDAPDVRQAYTQLRAQHGFRVLDYKVDQESGAPRVCVQFSERLKPDATNLAAYVRLDQRETQALAIEDKQACVDGLTHGKRYTIQVRQGLPAANGEVIEKSADLVVYVKDRSPSVRVAGRTYVLPTRGQKGLPLTTVNTDAIAVEVHRIGDRGLIQLIQNNTFQRQLSGYDLENLKDNQAQRVWRGELSVPMRQNEDVTTAFPIHEAVGKMEPGAYVLTAQALPKREGRNGQIATQWFIVSDLGITAFTGNDGIHAFVRSLAGAQPLANATVRLVAKSNEILATGTTDATGHARFDARLKAGEGAMAPALLVAETAAGDYAFLDLSSGAFDLTDRGVKGREPPGPIDAFIYTERGVYRAGESVHLTALVRDATARASNVATTLIVTRPDGVEARRTVIDDQGLGGRVTTWTAGQMSGTWRAKLYTDPKAAPIAQAAYLVEDFVPERLELKLEGKSKSLRPAGGEIGLTARYLYGPPAAGLGIEGEIIVKPAKSGLAAWPGYTFGRADEKFTTTRKPLDTGGTTKADGSADIAVQLPNLPRTTQPLDAELLIRVRESGGRAIERTLTLPVDPGLARLGIKPTFTNGQAGDGEMVGFDIVKLDTNGQATDPAGATWTLLKLEQRWQWFSRDGDWSYDTTTSSRKIAVGQIAGGSAGPQRITMPVEWGRYRLEVQSADGTQASLVFNAGHYSADAADSPELLDIALDKANYRNGETARVRVSSKLAGRALVAVMASGVTSTHEVDLAAGGGEIMVPVTAAMAPGAYVTVLHYRPMDEALKRMPGRAVGTAWLAVDADARRLAVTIDAPAQARGGEPLKTTIKLAGLATGEDARIVVTAVDSGVLNLTRTTSPKPEAWFFGQRRLGVELRDYYARLIDGMRADAGRLRSGGDGGADAMTMSGSPPSETTVAVHSGLVTPGADGIANIDLNLPDFNGLVRVSAVAWTAGKIGSAERDVTVRDPVALTLSAPRFLTLGDTARLEAALHNVDGGAGTYKLVVGQPSGETTRAVALATGERKRETLSLKPTTIGRQTISVTLNGPSGVALKRSLSIDVKPPAGDIRRTTVAELKAGGRLTLSPDLIQDLIPERTKVMVQIGPMSRLDPAGLLAELDRYPYGCAEQTVSRALPLLYANDVARAAGLATDGELKARIQAAADRVTDMQDSSGAFGIWGPADGDIWLTSYVTDFLLRARDKGVTIAPRVLSQALDRLQNAVATKPEFERGGEQRAYALYVLARGGRPAIGEMRYDADMRLDKFATPLAQAQLGAALAMAGDMPRANAAFAAAMKNLGGTEAKVLRQDYGSRLRDTAAIVTLASETNVSRTEVPRLIDVIAQARQTRAPTSTQEQAWLLLAASALRDQAATLSLNIGGTAHTGPLLRALTPADVNDGRLVITNTGDAATDAVVSVIGAALTPEPAISKGFTIERTFYAMDGKVVDLKSATGGTSSLKQNQRLVVVLKAEATEAGGRVLLVDRLPAGFEIENPRLVESGDLKGLDWLKPTTPAHTEFRDDRFIAAFNLFGNDRRRSRGDDEDGDQTREQKGPRSQVTVAYIVRAVTPGSFVHPAATIEDMYRPDRFARTASGRLEVTTP